MAGSDRHARADAAAAALPAGAARLVGILNLTPDSFSDGGRLADPGAAAAAAAAMAAAGADWIDLGGESTRPGADPVPADEELRRVLPALRAVRAACPGATLSIDTAKAAVAAAALDAGADAVNDVSAGADPAMLPLVAARGCRIVLMHSRGTPKDMQRDPRYADAVAEVAAELGARIAAAEAAGIPRARIIGDPGIGFGKRPADNRALLAGLEAIAGAAGAPLMVGISRKSFLAACAGADLPPAARDALSHQVHAQLAWRCAYLRVHDPAGAAAAIRLAAALDLPPARSR